MMKPSNHWFLTGVIIAAWTIISLFAPTTPLKSAVVALILVYLPGKLLSMLIAPRATGAGWWADLALSLGLSTTITMVLGLMLSFLGPLVGIAKPLTPMPLTLTLAAVMGGLLAASIAKHRPMFIPPFDRSRLSVRALILAGWFTLIPITAVMGALSINNHGPAILAALSMALMAVLPLIILWRQRADLTEIIPYAIYATSLGLLLGTSLRGTNITGHDIVQEYQVFQLTATNGIWNMNFLRDAYNACLSITILPTIWQKLTGLADPYIYKLMAQIVFAMLPVVIYLTAKRFSGRRQAFLAALVFMTFPVFLQDMSMLVRQEAAFFLLSLALMTVFDPELRARPKSALTLILLGGMIISHYSTSYITIAMLLAAKVLEVLIRVTKHTVRRRAANLWTPLTWSTIFALTLITYLWNAQVTKTSSSIGRTIGGITTNLPHLLDRNFASGQSNYALLGAQLTPAQNLASYVASAAKLFRDLPSSSYYPNTLTDQYPLKLKSETLSPTTDFVNTIGLGKVNWYNIFEFLRQIYAKLIQVLLLLAVGFMFLRPRATRIPRQFQLIGIGALAMVLLQVLLPPSIIDYGLLRLIHQSMIVLAIPMVLVALRLMDLIRIRELWSIRVFSVVLAGFFVVMSGLANSITGGHKPALALSNSGFYYEAYYAHDDELAAFNWLKSHAPIGAVVNADEFVRRQMVTYIGVYPRPSLAPDAIAEEAYAYVGHNNLSTDKVPLYYQGILTYHSVPTDFLDTAKDEVYSTQSVRIYE